MRHIKLFEQFIGNHPDIKVDYDYIYHSDNEFEDDYTIDEMKKKGAKFIKKILSMSKDNKILVYRQMCVDPDWVDKVLRGEIKGIGRYWSYDKEKANSHDYAYDNDNHISVLLTCVVDTEYIVWQTTLMVYFIFMEEETEAELKLNDDAVLTLLTIEKYSTWDKPSGEIIHVNKTGFVKYVKEETPNLRYVN